MVERGFRVFLVVLSCRRLTLFYLLQSNSTFSTLKKDSEGSSQGKAAKKLYETPTLTWWITKTGQSCHLCGLPQLTGGLGASSSKP
jgi:hypothetical protein